MAGGGALSLGRDIAIDLGTANTLVYVKGEGVVLNEPSSVAVDSRTGELVAVGFEAKRMWGRAPQNIRLVRPLQDGVIADFDVCEKMLRYFIQQVHTSRWNKPRMIICVPSEITGVERRAVQEAAEFAGARRPVYIIEEPMAAAIGAGLPVHLPSASLIVDIGGGTTEVAVISMGGIVTAYSARVAGDELNQAIVEMFRTEFSLDVGENTAEEVKLQLGSAWPLAEELTADVGGRDTLTGLPRTQVVTSEDVRSAIGPGVTAIVDAIKTTLERTPPELAADIIGHGLTLSGGGALLTGLAERVTCDTGIHAFLAPEPLFSVVLGCGMTLDNIEAMKGLTAQTSLE
ncbi:MAG: rod shape-determining protein [Actinobacteria bacterium]|nr:rod shape-determining protein [Actinomycetota bacterium]